MKKNPGLSEYSIHSVQAEFARRQRKLLQAGINQR
jgi:hypothetical protein